MANDTLEMTLLFDFFGDLLTDKQREYFDYYYNDDLSLSEIAEITGISRQGVRDVLLRARSLLCEYEEKTGVVKRFQELRSGISALQKDAELLAELTEGGAKETALRISEGLNKLKG
ncbi:MAG: YlxM family DNA-binding protein [Oscillospiraceae bacterium]